MNWFHKIFKSQAKKRKEYDQERIQITFEYSEVDQNGQITVNVTTLDTNDLTQEFAPVYLRPNEALTVYWPIFIEKPHHVYYNFLGVRRVNKNV